MTFGRWMGRSFLSRTTRRFTHCGWASPSVVAHETVRIDAATVAAGVAADLGLPIAADSFQEEFCRWPAGVLPGALALLDDIQHDVPARGPEQHDCRGLGLYRRNGRALTDQDLIQTAVQRSCENSAA